MAKVKTIRDINFRAGNQVIEIPQGRYINVSEDMAVFLCNEDIEAMSIEEQKKHLRFKKAIRTPTIEQVMSHTDYQSTL